MNIFVYSDESGVFDKSHNEIFVFGGIVFLSKEEKDKESRKYRHVEKTVRATGNYNAAKELKAAAVTVKQKNNLYRSMNQCYKFGVVIKQREILKEIWTNKKDKQRYLDYAYKIGVKRLFQQMMTDGVIDPNDVERIFFNVDEHTTATSGCYELQQSLEQEFKWGTYNWNYSLYFSPIFPKLQEVKVKFCNSKSTTLVRAADIIANNIYHKAISGRKFEPFNNDTCRLHIVTLP